MHGGEEISRGFVVACGDGSELLELTEKILNEMTRFVHLLVEGPLDFAVPLGRDHRGFTCRKKRVDDTLVGIEGFVRQQNGGFHLRQQHVGAFQIMNLARGEEESERITQRVDKSMDFGAQSALAAPDRLVFADFFWAPALC